MDSNLMDISDHRLVGVDQFDSPNQDARPTADLSLIVIHGISLPPGEFGGNEVPDLFLNNLHTGDPRLSDLVGERVSSHVFIRRNGEVLQFVPFDRRAWHAGASRFRGQGNCNDFSIGIELEGTDHLPYDEAQYQSLVGVCAALMRNYGIQEIRGHCDIAPGRKTDPGPAFSWLKLRRGLAGSL